MSAEARSKGHAMRKLFGSILLLLALALPFAAQASYTYNTSGANASSGNTVTMSPATGALVVVFSVTSGGGGTPTITCSDNSSSAWANASNNVVVSGLHYSVCYTLSAAAGVTTITVTYNGGNPGSINIAAASYTGMGSPSFVAVAAPNVQVSPGTATNAIVSNSVACGSTNALFVGFSTDVSVDNTFSAGTGFTQRYSNDPNLLGMLIEDPNTEVTGSQTATFSTAAHGTDTFASLAIAFANHGGATRTNQNGSLMGVSKLIQQKPPANDSNYSHKKAA
jgi:hypothetical protein